MRMRLVPDQHFQEYSSLGLLTFSYSRGKIVYCRQEKGFAYNQKNYRLASIYRNVPAIVWKKGLQVVRESKKPEQNLRWDLRNSFMRK